MVWPLIAAVVGGAMANSAANKQSAAITKANEQNNQYLNAVMPYVTENIGNVKGSYENMLTQGPYTGGFYAGPNSMMTNGNNMLYNTGSSVNGRGNDMYNMGMSMANTGINFGNNANDLYGKFSNMSGDFQNRVGQFDALANNQNNLANDYSNIRDGIGNYRSNFNDLATNSGAVTDRFGALADRAMNNTGMADAASYAMDNMNPIVNAMMRDDRRTLTEQTLPGINQAASGSGNVNSSRAGVADAMANRAFDDRLVDTKTTVFNQLRDAKLNQDNKAFDQSMTGTVNMANNMNNTAGFYNNGLNTYVGQGNMTGNMGTAYGNAGNALTAGNNTMTSAGNMLSNAGTANSMLGTAFSTGVNTATTGNNAAITGANTMLGAGTNQQGWDQGALNADRAQYDYTTGYGYNLGKDYGSFLAQGSPGSGNYQANMINPGMSTMAGAMQGFGFGNQYGPQIGNMIGNSSFANPMFGGSGLGLRWA